MPGQVSYFSGYEGDSTKILKREIKTIYQRNGYSVAYFHDGFEPGCQADKIHGSFNGYLTDSLILDSTGYHYQRDNLTIYWPTQAQVGHSWRIPWPYAGSYLDSIEIRYDSIVLGNFLGLTDSIRHFTTTALKQGNVQPHSINGHGIQISKHHGLVKTIGLFPFPIDVFTYANVLYPGKLVGIEFDTIKMGFMLPDIMDFFNFAPGDVLKWEKKETPYEIMYGPEKTWIYRDSVLSVSATDSIASYTFVRATQHEGSVYHGTTGQAKYERSYYNFLTKSLSFYLSGYPYFSDNLWLHDAIHIDNDDICLAGRFDGLIIQNCIPSFIADASESVRICRNQGIVFSSWSHSGGETTYKLLGRTSNTDTIGDIRPLGISLAIPHTIVQLYPNPATESFYLSLPKNFPEPDMVHITDMQGRVVHREQYKHGAQISIVHIAAGTYVVSVETQHWVAHLKLLKQ